MSEFKPVEKNELGVNRGQDEVGADQAREILNRAAQAKVAACSKDIQKVLNEHGCRIEVAMLVTPRGNVPQITIVPVD